jgi:glyoxylase-like metal-dependent hydrolase (beta-lactamase superfamily II)
MQTSHAATTDFPKGIVAIDTDYVRPAFDASHLIIEAGRAAFVDTGTSFAVPLLLDALAQYGLTPADVDYVFLTHVHLDHAGGAGALLQQLPSAQAVIHPRGASHLIDPAKLIAGTKAVYGEEAYRKIYGEIVPIAADRVIVADDNAVIELGGRPLQMLFTEGHARHHYCLWDSKSASMFSGDSFGVSYRELDGPAGPFVFPSSTPIDFDPQAAKDSIKRIMSYKPEFAYLTHYSRITVSEQVEHELTQGIDFLVELADKFANDDDRSNAISAGMLQYIADRVAHYGGPTDKETISKVFGFDVRLNTMGLEVWLDRKAKKQGNQ